jgi:ribosomal RNA-processing protein 7
MSKGACHIKGYLPVRLALPPSVDGTDSDEAFFFVREHHAGRKEQQDNHTNKANTTLFVANAPIVPGISTKVLLRSLLGRFGDITRVTVVDNPRQAAQAQRNQIIGAWTKLPHPSFLPPVYAEGKFAHVVFQTKKDMKKAMRGLEDIMKDSVNGKLELEPIEIQTLADETKRQHDIAEKELFKGDGSDQEDDSNDDIDEAPSAKKELKGVLLVAERYRQGCSKLTRSRLLQECNAVMQAYENAEEEARQARETAKAMPDDDGFVTVTYNETVGDKNELEMETVAVPRRKGNKRSRKKKTGNGGGELEDFYRFQRKENRKRTLEDLRKQFEEDLQQVKKMKEDRQYRPF